MSYTPTNWQTGDTVTAEKLNNMESGIELGANLFVITLTPTAQDLSGTMDKTPEEINSAILDGLRIMFSIPSFGGYVEATQFLYVPADDINVAYANLVFDPGIGTCIIQINTSSDNSIYFTHIYPLTPMS